MTKDERDRLVRVEAMAPMLEEVRHDVKELLAAYNRQQGYITAAGVVLASLSAMIGAAVASLWPRLKELL